MPSIFLKKNFMICTKQDIRFQQELYIQIITEKKFTGFVDDHGKYTARYIGNVENDRYYRSAPLSEVTFNEKGATTNVNIKVKSKYNAFYFGLSLLVLIVAIVLLIVLFNTSLKIPFIAITAVAVVINGIVLAISKKSVDDVLSEFYYIFKFNNN